MEKYSMYGRVLGCVLGGLSTLALGCGGEPLDYASDSGDAANSGEQEGQEESNAESSDVESLKREAVEGGEQVAPGPGGCSECNAEFVGLGGLGRLGGLVEP